MEKKAFVTKEKVEEIAKTYPTPFYLYDEKGIRENVAAVKKAFSWNPGYREYFAVKATPNPEIIKILNEYDCGTDCASKVELMFSKALDLDGDHIMFSSNDTPAEEYTYAKEIGAIINLDDITHIDFCEKACGGELPETMSCRFNPGGVFQMSNGIMDNPGDAKYGMSEGQMKSAFKTLMEKGVKHFGIHAFLASNTVTNEYYPKLARQLFELAVRLHKETGADIRFINLSGGVGVAYQPSQTPNDIAVIGEGVHEAYDDVLVPNGMGDVAIYTEMGRFMLAPYGALAEPDTPLLGGVVDEDAGAPQGHRLVQALAAVIDREVRGLLGLPGFGDVLHAVDIVHVHGPKIQDFQKHPSLWLRLYHKGGVRICKLSVHRPGVRAILRYPL